MTAPRHRRPVARGARHHWRAAPSVSTHTRPLMGPVPLLAVGVLAGLLLASGGALDAWRLAAVALLLAGSLLLQVPVPWGGSVPLGFALAGALPALPALQPAGDGLLVIATGVALAAAAALRTPNDQAFARALRLAPALAGLAAVAALRAVDIMEVNVVVAAVTGILAVLAADVLLTRWLPVEGAHVELVPVLAVYLTLGCGAVLIAVATDRVGVVMAAAAAFPLLVTRFSFGRYAGAAETLRQTVQALGLVPELAGVAPLGQSERSSFYATALARRLGLPRLATARVVSATRLHRLGAVLVDRSEGDGQPAGPEPDATEIARHGAQILREAGFPRDVADLIEAARAGSPDGPSGSLEAAIVRVATAFDGMVGDDEARTDAGLAVVSATSLDPDSRRVAAALLELVATRPLLVREAIRAGALFNEAAAGLDLDALVTSPAGGEILPFVRRRR